MGLVQLKLDLFHDYNTSYLIEEIVLDKAQQRSLEKFLDLVKENYGPLSEILDSVLNLIAEVDKSDMTTDDHKNITKTTYALEKVKSIIELSQTIWGYMTSEIDEGTCVWVEHDKENNTSEIHIKEIDVGEKIKEHFFLKELNKTYDGKFFMEIPPRVVITSATLSTGENFDFIKGQLGVDSVVKTYEFIGESPFNLTEQQLWYLPPGAIEGNKKEFQEYFVRETEKRINNT